MKKINLIAPILASGAAIGAIVPMVSCGNKTFTCEFNADEHYYFVSKRTYDSGKTYIINFQVQEDMTSGIKICGYSDGQKQGEIWHFNINYIKFGTIQVDEEKINVDETSNVINCTEKFLAGDPVQISIKIDGGVDSELRIYPIALTE